MMAKVRIISVLRKVMIKEASAKHVSTCQADASLFIFYVLLSVLAMSSHVFFNFLDIVFHILVSELIVLQRA